jgi:hypothetical protein
MKALPHGRASDTLHRLKSMLLFLSLVPGDDGAEMLGHRRIQRP